MTMRRDTATPIGNTSDRSQLLFNQPSQGSVGRLIRVGVLWSGLFTMLTLVLNFVFTAFLARMLAPQDYGLVAMVTVFSALIIELTDMGLSLTTIQRPDLSLQQVHNLFWLNSGMGFIVGTCIIALAPLISNFYSEPRLTPIAITSGITFAIRGIAVQPMALLGRQMLFKQAGSVKISSTIVSGLIALMLAFSGQGVWALVWQSLSSSITVLIMALILTGYRPGKVSRGSGTRPLIQFGGLLALNGMILYLARNLDNLLIGRVWGASELGLYSRAYFLMSLPAAVTTGLVAPVMLSGLSALQHDRERFGNTYRQAFRFTAIIGFPLAVGLGLVAPEAIQIAYGSRWSQVVPIFSWLAIAAAFQPIFSTSSWLFTSTGKVKALFHSTILHSLLVGGSFLVGIQHGAIGVARAYTVAFVVLVTFPILYLAHRAAGLPFQSSLRTIAPAAASTMVMATTVLALNQAFQNSPTGWVTALAIKIAVAIICYGILILTLDAWVRTMLRTKRPRLRPRPAP